MINKVILMGRLVCDPELRHTGAGKPVCNFRIAVNDGYGENKKTSFIQCISWNKTAERIYRYFQKGSMIIVDGKMSSRTWEDNNGRKNYVIEVIAQNVSFGEAKKAG